MSDNDLSKVSNGSYLGEIKTATELGLIRKFQYSYYIWCPCSKCGTTKWWSYRRNWGWEEGNFNPLCKYCVEYKGTFQPGHKLTPAQSKKRSEQAKIYYSDPINHAKLIEMAHKHVKQEPVYGLVTCPQCNTVNLTILKNCIPFDPYCGKCGTIQGTFVSEIKTANEIGKPRGSHKFIWIKCRKCNTHKWVPFEKGKPRTTYCLNCALLLNAERRIGRRIPQPKLRKNRPLNLTPPILGEIRFGAEVGRKVATHGKVIWHSCENCGKERWVSLMKGIPQHRICCTCGQKGKIFAASLDTTRKCSTCGEIFPATKEYFYTNDSKLGITSICKHCAVQSQIKRRSNDPKLRLQHAVSGEISRSLKGNKNGRHWETLVGYTLKDLITHIESQFTDGMSWDNYGSKAGNWSIDHICPVVAHNFKTANDMDFHRCWQLSNLRPLWHIDNMRKNDKPDKPFQPSLALGIKEKHAVYTA